MNKLLTLIDRYLVPVYKKDGWIPVLVFLAFGLSVILLAVWLGFGDMVKGLLGE